MGACHIRVSSGVRDSACVVTVNGELTLAIQREFAVRTVQALAASRGPVLFGVSGVEFPDCHGTRPLARAIRLVPPRPVGLKPPARCCAACWRRSRSTSRRGSPSGERLQRLARLQPARLPSAASGYVCPGRA